MRTRLRCVGCASLHAAQVLVGAVVAANGHHGLCCTRSAGRQPHNTQNEVVRRAREVFYVLSPSNVCRLSNFVLRFKPLNLSMATPPLVLFGGDTTLLKGNLESRHT